MLAFATDRDIPGMKFHSVQTGDDPLHFLSLHWMFWFAKPPILPSFGAHVFQMTGRRWIWYMCRHGLNQPTVVVPATGPPIQYCPLGIFAIDPSLPPTPVKALPLALLLVYWRSTVVDLHPRRAPSGALVLCFCSNCILLLNQYCFLRLCRSLLFSN